MEREFVAVRVAVLLVSGEPTERDTATVNVIARRLTAAGHVIAERVELPDDAARVRARFERWLADPAIDVVIAVAGIETASTGEALAPLITRPIEGFADLFRMLTFGEIGTGAMLVDVTAAQCGETFVFVLPASQGAVTTAVEKLLVPQLDHRTKPRNLVLQMRKRTAAPSLSIPPGTPSREMRTAAPSLSIPPGTPSGETQAIASPGSAGALRTPEGSAELIDESMLEAVPTPIQTETTDVGVPPPPVRGARAKTMPPPVPPAVRKRVDTQPPPELVTTAPSADPLMAELASVVTKAETERPRRESSKVEPIVFDPSKHSNPELKLPGVTTTPAKKPPEVDPPSKVIVDDSLPSTIDSATAAGDVAATSKSQPFPKLPAVIVDDELAPVTELPAPKVAAVTAVTSESMFDEQALAAPRRRRRTRRLIVVAIAGLAIAGVTVYAMNRGARTEIDRPPVPSSPMVTPLDPASDPDEPSEPAGAVAVVAVDAAEPEIEMDPAEARDRHHHRHAGSGSGGGDVESPDNPDPTGEECDQVTCILEKFARPCCAKYPRPPDLASGSGSATPSAPQRDPSLPPETLDRALIKQGVDRVRGLIIACRDTAPGVKGTVRVQVAVAASGQVGKVALAESPDPGLGQCVIEAMRKTSFAETTSGGSFDYPFVF